MSYTAQVFRILIASPSDVNEEREIAVRTIQEWNDLNSAERQIALLPLRWETHSSPQYGDRPQEIINKQVVDHCDILVGVFWSRIGTPTGKADSGTQEEIERVVESGKPVMLYFSQAKHDIESIDPQQLIQLREFKQKILPKALIEHYTNPVEFRDKLWKQLEIQLRQLLAVQPDTDKPKSIVRPVTDIQILFADPEVGTEIGDAVIRKSEFITVPDFNKIPDYQTPREADKDTDDPKQDLTWGGVSKAVSAFTFGPASPNENYYRELITLLLQRSFFVPVRFWVKNFGGVGARDVYVDVQIFSRDADIVIVRPTEIPANLPPRTKPRSSWFGSSHKSSPEDITKNSSRDWSTNLEIKALQPQREISPSTNILVGAENTTEIEFRARIFADTLPEPQMRSLKMTLEVEKITAHAKDILPNLDK